MLLAKFDIYDLGWKSFLRMPRKNNSLKSIYHSGKSTGCGAGQRNSLCFQLR